VIDASQIPPPPHPDDEVCSCFELRARDLIELIRQWRPESLRALQKHTPAGTLCGACHPLIAALIIQRTMRR
jgi:NAD(P)H-nitrite reductase large subunit